MNTAPDLLRTSIHNRLEALFAESTNPAKNRLHAAARHLLLGSGKRLRPLIVISTAELFGAQAEAALDPACALEMIHTYSLIHDDLPCMDNDDYRRGLPTVHRKFDEATAVLAGDLLLTVAFEVLANAPLLSSDQRLQLISLFSADAGQEGMIGGQMMDLLAEGNMLSKEEILSVYAYKTSALISAGFVAGGIIGRSSKEELLILKRFGTHLGLIFQIVDDILDVTNSQEHKGCALSSDMVNDKSTLVSLIGIEESTAIAYDLKKTALELLEKLSIETSSLRELTEKIIEKLHTTGSIAHE